MNVFLSCVSEKADHRCQAKDLYISPLFQKSYAYAQKLNPDNIYILSAKHYVVDIDEEISPYNETLNDMSADEKREWVDNVLKKLDEKGIDRNEKTIFLAGHSYLDYLIEYFSDYEIPYQDEGLSGIGYILQWLDEQIGVELSSQIDNKYNVIIKNRFQNSMNIKLLNRLKLAKLLIQFREVRTDNGTLTMEGELVIGQDVFIEQDGELVIAPDGEYKTEDGKTITVVSGKIEAIVEPETESTEEVEPIVEEQPIENEEVENPTNDGEETDTEAIVEIRKEVDELYKRINELEEIIKGKDAEIEKLNSHIEQFSKPAIEEVEVVTNKENKFSKFFKK